MKTLVLEVGSLTDSMAAATGAWKAGKAEGVARVSFASAELLWKVLTAQAAGNSAGKTERETRWRIGQLVARYGREARRSREVFRAADAAQRATGASAPPRAEARTGSKARKGRDPPSAVSNGAKTCQDRTPRSGSRPASLRSARSG